MQPYYAIKLKCFVLRLMMGCSLLLISAGIVVSILQEVMNSYDANSRLAYILGLLICALMVALGTVLIYQAFHFERFVFGRSQRSYDLLKKDMQDKSVVSAGNLIVTDQFMLLFSKHIFNMCKVIRLENVIACFEEPVYGTVAKPSEYTLYILTGILSAILLYWMRSNQRPDTRQRRRFVRHIRGFMQSVVILFLIARCLKTAEGIF